MAELPPTTAAPPPGIWLISPSARSRSFCTRPSGCSATSFRLRAASVPEASPRASTQSPTRPMREVSRPSGRAKVRSAPVRSERSRRCTVRFLSTQAIRSGLTATGATSTLAAGVGAPITVIRPVPRSTTPRSV
ncbi:hypothetical protein O1L60_20245 [Streptomyces diastatochromogenes]|nr:hypothetical protein [Streptomyces diastatochromogenes]